MYQKSPFVKNNTYEMLNKSLDTSSVTEEDISIDDQNGAISSSKTQNSTQDQPLLKSISVTEDPSFEVAAVNSDGLETSFLRIGRLCLISGFILLMQLSRFQGKPCSDLKLEMRNKLHWVIWIFGWIIMFELLYSCIHQEYLLIKSWEQ